MYVLVVVPCALDEAEEAVFVEAELLLEELVLDEELLLEEL